MIDEIEIMLKTAQEIILKSHDLESLAETNKGYEFKSKTAEIAQQKMIS